MTLETKQDFSQCNNNLLENDTLGTIKGIAWIATPRSGTNYLCELLQNHHQIESHFEVFHRQKFYAKNRQEVIDYINQKYSKSFSNYRDESLINWIHSEPQKLICVLEDLCQANQFFSFKIFPGQLNNKLTKQNIIHNRSIKKVLIKRNLLDVYISRSFALQLEKWSKINTSKMQLKFDFDDFIKWYNWVNEWYEIFEEELHNTNQNYTTVLYQEVHQHNTDLKKFYYLINILKDLGVNLDLNDDNLTLEDTEILNKQDKRTDRAKKISNYQEVQDKIIDFGLEHLLQA